MGITPVTAFGPTQPQFGKKKNKSAATGPKPPVDFYPSKAIPGFQRHVFVKPLYYASKPALGGFPVHISDADKALLTDIRKQADAGKTRVLLMPNHPSHLDMLTGLAVARFMNTDFGAMMAPKMFKTPVVRQALQWANIHSASASAGTIDVAVEQLEKKPFYGLLVEGFITLTNRVIQRTKSGPAKIALKYLEKHPDEKVLLLPYTAYYNARRDNAPQLVQLAEKLEDKLAGREPGKHKLDKNATQADAVAKTRALHKTVVNHLVAQYTADYGLDVPDGGTADERMKALEVALRDHLEAKYGVTNGDKFNDPLERAENVDKAVYRAREKVGEDVYKADKRTSMQLMLISSFVPGYLDNPDRNQLMETLLKFHQVLHGKKGLEPGMLKEYGKLFRDSRMESSVKVVEPLDVGAFCKTLPEGANAEREITLELRRRMQETISSIVPE